MWWGCICCSQRTSEAQGLVYKKTLPGPQFQRWIGLVYSHLLIYTDKYVNLRSFPVWTMGRWKPRCGECAHKGEKWNMRLVRTVIAQWFLVISVNFTVSPSYRCATCRHWDTSGSDSIGICCGTSCECDSGDHSGRTPTLAWLCVWRNPAKQKEQDVLVAGVGATDICRVSLHLLRSAHSATFNGWESHATTVQETYVSVFASLNIML